MPTGPGSSSLQRAVEVALDYIGVHGKRKRITDETVDAVRADGTAIVGGESIGTMGVFKGMQAGDRVKVAWSRTGPNVKKPKRNMILAHQVRRNIPPTGFVQGATVLEELFVSTRPDGKKDVYFRDAYQCVPLKLDAIGIDTSGLQYGLDYVKWGPSNNRFFVHTGDRFFDFGLARFVVTKDKYHVIKIDREAHKAFASAVDVASLITEESSVNMLSNSTTIATISPVGASGSLTLTPITQNGSIFGWSAGLTLLNKLLDDRGHLIFAYSVVVNKAILPIEPTGAIESRNITLFVCGGSALNRFFVQINLHYPVIVDMTSGEILLSGLLDDLSGVFGPAYQGSIINVNTTSFANGYPGSWEAVGFNITDDCSASWQIAVFYPQFREYGNYDMWPLFVSFLEEEGDTKTALNGWIGWSDIQSRSIRVFQNGGVHGGIFAPDPGTPAPPGPLDGRRQITMCASSIENKHSILNDSNVSPDFPGFILGGATYNHLVWQHQGGSQFRPNDGFVAFNPSNPCFITWMDDGSTVEYPEQVSSVFRQHNNANAQGVATIYLTGTDFAYRLDTVLLPPNPALPSTTPFNFFVNLWSFIGLQVTPNDILQSSNFEDVSMSKLKALAPLPDGVFQDATNQANSGNLDIQVVNDPTILKPIRKYEAP